MCLDKLTTFKVPKYGYKIFTINGYTNELFSWLKGDCNKVYPMNKILDEKYFRVFSHKKMKTLFNYKFGFHIFQTLKSAKKKYDLLPKDSFPDMVIYKVEIIEPHTTGIEFLQSVPCHVIVSKKMRIIEKV